MGNCNIYPPFDRKEIKECYPQIHQSNQNILIIMKWFLAINLKINT